MLLDLSAVVRLSWHRALFRTKILYDKDAFSPPVLLPGLVRTLLHAQYWPAEVIYFLQIRKQWTQGSVSGPSCPWFNEMMIKRQLRGRPVLFIPCVLRWHMCCEHDLNYMRCLWVSEFIGQDDQVWLSARIVVARSVREDEELELRSQICEKDWVWQGSQRKKKLW